MNLIRRFSGIFSLLILTVWTAQAQAPNDDFVNAQVINGALINVNGNNFNTDKEPGEPNHAGPPGSAAPRSAPRIGQLRPLTLGVQDYFT